MWQSEISHWHRGPQWRRESAWKNLLLWRTCMIQQIEEIGQCYRSGSIQADGTAVYADVDAEELRRMRAVIRIRWFVAVKVIYFSISMKVSRLQILLKYLKVNPDYLSHLFKEQEHITIKRYILQEKSAEAGICYSIRITVFRKSVSIWASALRAISVRCFRRSQGRHRGIIRGSLPIGRNGRFSKIKLRIMAKQLRNLIYLSCFFRL